MAFLIPPFLLCRRYCARPNTGLTQGCAKDPKMAHDPMLLGWHGLFDSADPWTLFGCRIHAGPNSRFQHNILSPNLSFHFISIDMVVTFPTAISSHELLSSLLTTLPSGKRPFFCLCFGSQCSFLSVEAPVLRHSSLSALLSDNGLNFSAHIDNELSTLFGDCPTFAAHYHPVTNGAVERENGMLSSIIWKMTASDPLHWTAS